jgi:hypothetical protein
VSPLLLLLLRFLLLLISTSFFLSFSRTRTRLQLQPFLTQTKVLQFVFGLSSLLPLQTLRDLLSSYSPPSSSSQVDPWLSRVLSQCLLQFQLLVKESKEEDDGGDEEVKEMEKCQFRSLDDMRNSASRFHTSMISQFFSRLGEGEPNSSKNIFSDDSFSFYSSSSRKPSLGKVDEKKTLTVEEEETEGYDSGEVIEFEATVVLSDEEERQKKRKREKEALFSSEVLDVVEDLTSDSPLLSQEEETATLTPSLETMSSSVKEKRGRKREEREEKHPKKKLKTKPMGGSGDRDRDEDERAVNALSEDSLRWTAKLKSRLASLAGNSSSQPSSSSDSGGAKFNEDEIKGLQEVVERGAAKALGVQDLVFSSSSSNSVDDVISLLVDSLKLEDLSYRACVALIRWTMLSRAKTLRSAASRVLISALIKMAQKHPRPIVDAFLIPLFSLFSAGEGVREKGEPLLEMGSAQGEIVTRLAKECLPQEMLSEFVKELARSGDQWTELSVTVLSNVIQLKPTLDEAGVGFLLSCLKKNSEGEGGTGERVSTSIKFATLVLNFIVKYGSGFTSHQKELLRDVVLARNTTFVAKTALNKLDTL